MLPFISQFDCLPNFGPAASGPTDLRHNVLYCSPQIVGRQKSLAFTYCVRILLSVVVKPLNRRLNARLMLRNSLVRDTDNGALIGHQHLRDGKDGANGLPLSSRPECRGREEEILLTHARQILEESPLMTADDRRQFSESSMWLAEPEAPLDN